MKKNNNAQLISPILLIALIFFFSSFIKNQKFSNNNVNEYPKDSLPLAAIALDRMNVFYIGVDNPITVAVEGIPNEKVNVKISSGYFSGYMGKYMVHVTTPGETIIDVFILVNGKEILIKSTKYRVKFFPPPINGKSWFDFDTTSLTK